MFLESSGCEVNSQASNGTPDGHVLVGRATSPTPTVTEKLLLLGSVPPAGFSDPSPTPN